MNIDGHKVTVERQADVIEVGGFLFLDPVVRQVISNSAASPSGPHWFIHVDVVEYITLLAEQAGRSAGDALNLARTTYIDALASFDIDPFEAEMFWETYQDAAYAAENPYALNDGDGKWDRAGQY